MTDAAFPLFDGHNDTLLRLLDARQKKQKADFFRGVEGFHIDMPKAKRGGFAGGLFAMFTPNPEGSGALAGAPIMGAPIERERAVSYTHAMMDIGAELIEHSEGAIRQCNSVADIRAAMEDDAMALVYHIEGAEVIDADFAALDALYARGLRSIGIVWSRNTIFGNGVPFTFPGSPDHGPGLTDLGKELVRRCNRMGLMVDLSHLNEQGFWDVAKISDRPLVASHSNVHALTPSPRNLTDKQLDAIAENGGLVGLNFASGFLRSDGNHGNADVPFETMLRHLDHLIERLGEDGVGIGSDFDGCTVPAEIKDAGGVPNLVAAMERADYGKVLIGKIMSGNWLRVLERSWGE